VPRLRSSWQRWFAALLCALAFAPGGRADRTRIVPIQGLDLLGTGIGVAANNNRGQVAGTQWTPFGSARAFLWRDGELRQVPAASAYVSDTVDDLRMGQRGGARKVIGVASGLSSAEELASLTPYVCDRLPGPG